MNHRPAVRIPEAERARVSRLVRELVARGYSPRYAAQLAYHKHGRSFRSQGDFESWLRGAHEKTLHAHKKAKEAYARTKEAYGRAKAGAKRAHEKGKHYYARGKHHYGATRASLAAAQRAYREHGSAGDAGRCSRDCVGIHTHENLGAQMIQHAKHRLSRDPSRADRLIDESASRGRVAWGEWSKTLAGELKSESDDHVEGNDGVVEYWGTRGDGREWRVHLRRAASRDRLSAAGRRKLRSTQFALPKRKALPLEDAAHVRAAASRLEQMRRRGTVTPSEYRAARLRILRADRRFKVGAFRSKKV